MISYSRSHDAVIRVYDEAASDPNSRARGPFQRVVAIRRAACGFRDFDHLRRRFARFKLCASPFWAGPNFSRVTVLAVGEAMAAGVELGAGWRATLGRKRFDNQSQTRKPSCCRPV